LPVHIEIPRSLLHYSIELGITPKYLITFSNLPLLQNYCEHYQSLFIVMEYGYFYCNYDLGQVTQSKFGTFMQIPPGYYDKPMHDYVIDLILQSDPFKYLITYKLVFVAIIFICITCINAFMVFYWGFYALIYIFGVWILLSILNFIIAPFILYREQLNKITRLGMLFRICMHNITIAVLVSSTSTLSSGITSSIGFLIYILYCLYKQYEREHQQ